MRNYIQPGHIVTVPSPVAVKSGEGVVIGAIFGIACGDAEIGKDLDLRMEGVFELPKVDGDTFAVGDIVYFDKAAKLATTIADGNQPIGFAIADAASVSVRLTA